MAKPPAPGPHSDIEGVNREARVGRPNQDARKGTPKISISPRSNRRADRPTPARRHGKAEATARLSDAWRPSETVDGVDNKGGQCSTPIGGQYPAPVDIPIGIACGSAGRTRPGLVRLLAPETLRLIGTAAVNGQKMNSEHSDASVSASASDQIAPFAERRGK
jgi:hypothetical protein